MIKKIYSSLLLLLAAGTTQAQVVFVQNGADVTIQGSGGSIYVTGAGTTSIENRGSIDNYGTIDAAGHFLNYQTTGQINLRSGSVYNVGGNWTNNGSVVSTTDAIVEFRGASVQDITAIGGTATQWKFGHVRLNTPGLNLLSNMEVRDGGTLDFNNNVTASTNIITTNSNYLELGRSANVTGISAPGGANALQNYSFVNGTLRRLTDATTTYSFPVGLAGTGTAQGAQTMTIAFSGDPTSENITHLVATYSDAFGSLPSPANACGTVNPTIYTGTWDFHAFDGVTPVENLAALNYNLTLNARNIDGTTNAPTGFATLVKHGSDSDFRYVQNDGSPLTFNYYSESCQRGTNANAITATNLFGFSSAKGLKDNSTDPFPVELLSFEARPLKSTISLDWITSSERNCSHFDLERSLNGTDFQSIKSNIPAHGTTTQTNVYRHEDEDVKFNVTYFYRLRQVDFDGKAMYSQVREARLTNDSRPQSTFTLYPNPANENLTVQTFMVEEGPVQIKFFNLLGQNLFENKYTLAKGPNLINLSNEVQKLSAGPYIIEVRFKNQVQTQKFVVTR